MILRDLRAPSGEDPRCSEPKGERRVRGGRGGGRQEKIRSWVAIFDLLISPIRPCFAVDLHNIIHGFRLLRVALRKRGRPLAI